MMMWSIALFSAKATIPPRFADLEGGLQRCVVRIRCVLGLFEERLGLLSRCASVRLSAALP